jgi:hypothetical protein
MSVNFELRIYSYTLLFIYFVRKTEKKNRTAVFHSYNVNHDSYRIAVKNSILHICCLRTTYMVLSTLMFLLLLVQNNYPCILLLF